MTERIQSRAVIAILATMTMLAACSGGDEANEANEAADTPPTNPADEPTTTATDAPSTPDPSDDSVDDEEAPDDLAALIALEGATSAVVAPDAEHRCERLDYVCSWSDLDESQFDATLELAAEVQQLIDAEDDPELGIDAALQRLASEPVTELIVDREGYTGMLYRLEGTPELFATTALAAPIGDPVTLDLTELGEAIAELEALPRDEAPAVQGFAGPLTERYHPSGGPRTHKRGIVLDPFATEAVDCPVGAPPDGCFADPKDGRNEGSAIYAMMSAHPQISATYFQGANVAPWNLMNLASYDLVHLASHGTSGCANKNEGWTSGVTIIGDESDEGFVESQRGAFRSTPLDPNRCYSVSVLGPFDKAAYDAWGQSVPPGIGMNGTRWAAMTDFFVGKFKPEAIVYLSNCTSADGQLFSSGKFGSFVGWHSYARTTVAYQAGIEFWRLMVVEGVEFDVATEWLADEGLNWSITAQGSLQLDGYIPEGFGVGASGAFMATAGKNQRARDVVTVRLDGADVGGQVLRVHGLPNDGNPEYFPADEQQLSIDIEGVKEGTDGDVTIDVFADGVELEHELKLDTHGSIQEDRDGWATWRIVVPEGAIELPDTDASDFAPDATPIDLEVRVYETSSEYTADGGEVRLGAHLASNGPLPIFTELANGMPPNGELRGNDLEIQFDTAGGEVTGHMLVEMSASGFDLGYWQLDLTGTYDPASGQLTGELTGVSEGGFGSIRAGDSGSGTWQASVDLSGHTVNGTLGIGGQSQSYQGTLRPASTSTG